MIKMVQPRDTKYLSKTLKINAKLFYHMMVTKIAMILKDRPKYSIYELIAM